MCGWEQVWLWIAVVVRRFESISLLSRIFSKGDQCLSEMERGVGEEPISRIVIN